MGRGKTLFACLVLFIVRSFSPTGKTYGRAGGHPTPERKGRKAGVVGKGGGRVAAERRDAER